MANFAHQCYQLKAISFTKSSTFSIVLNDNTDKSIVQPVCWYKFEGVTYIFHGHGCYANNIESVSFESECCIGVNQDCAKNNTNW